MQRILGAVVIIALIALLVLGLVQRKPQSAGDVVPKIPPAQTAPEKPVELTAPVTSAAEPKRETAPVKVEAVDKPNATAPNAAANSECELRGRFLLPDGAPVAGVQLSIMAWESNQERVLRFGVPEHFEPPKGTSGSDGRFSIRFDPPRAYQFVLDGKLPGYCKASWRWGEIEPGKVVDVGDVPLVRGGSVRGRVVDGKGNVLKTGWMVYGEAPRTQAFAEGVEPVRVIAAPDPVTGEFLLDGLPPAHVKLTADSRVANWIEGPTVDVRVGEETRADIVYTGPDISSRITVVRFSNPYYVFDFDFGETNRDGTRQDTSVPDTAGIFLNAPGFGERRARKIANSSQSWSFDDVPAGTYTVEVRDPRFLPWSKSGVKPGTSIDAHLVGNAVVVLDVVDDATKQPVEHFSLDVRFDNVNFGPSTFRILETKDEPPRGGVFSGLVPHDQTLFVNAPGYAPCEVAASGLAANERRALTARLTHGRALRGFVVQGAAKNRVAGAKLQLRPVTAPSQKGEMNSLETDPRTVETTSDARGAFAFSGLPAGDFEITCNMGPLVLAKQTATMPSDTEPQPVEIVLPAAGRLVGRILAPDGASFAGLRVLTRPALAEGAQEEPGSSWFFLPPEASAEVAADGTFRSPPVPAGSVVAMLQCPNQVTPSVDGSSSTQGGHVELGTFELAAGVDTHKEFDLRTAFPGSAAVHVTLNGKPANALIVWFWCNQGDGAVGVCDSSGACRVGPMLPGAYRILVRPIDAGWVYVDPRTVTVPSAGALELDAAIVLFDGTFQVKDAASHQPLSSSWINLAPDPNPTGANCTSQTDDDGRVHLSLPAGHWSVGLNGMYFADPAKSGVFVDWGAQGASPKVLELEPAKK